MLDRLELVEMRPSMCQARAVRQDGRAAQAVRRASSPSRARILDLTHQAHDVRRARCASPAPSHSGGRANARLWGNCVRASSYESGTALFGAGRLAFQRAEIAQDAGARMVGMSKPQVVACMGAPANKAAEGATEMWGCNSSNGMTLVNASYGR